MTIMMMKINPKRLNWNLPCCTWSSSLHEQTERGKRKIGRTAVVDVFVQTGGVEAPTDDDIPRCTELPPIFPPFFFPLFFPGVGWKKQ
jgi:hypothetical protein